MKRYEDAVASLSPERGIERVSEKLICGFEDAVAVAKRVDLTLLTFDDLTLKFKF